MSLRKSLIRKPTRLEEIDRFLADGGFTRAKRPKGALKRHRSRKIPAAVPQKGRRNGLEIMIAGDPQWNQPWLIHGFSTRSCGYSRVFGAAHDLNLGFGKYDKKEIVEKNRAVFFKSLGASKLSLVSPKQIHSSIIIHTVSQVSERKPTADGLITNVPGILLSVQTADCVPVLLVDTKRKVVGAFHAGWRGTVKRIVEKGVGAMRLRYGSSPRDIRAAIGPCIGQCCYAVGEEVAEEFRSQFAYADALLKPYFEDDPIKIKYPLLFMTARAPGHSNLGPQIHLDLVEANRRQLRDAGVPQRNIWTSGECTSCNATKFFSHRKEAGFTGRMMAVIGMKP